MPYRCPECKRHYQTVKGKNKKCPNCGSMEITKKDGWYIRGENTGGYV